MTSCIGREAEIPDIAAAVRSRRLVTLTGVGGVGKTRLATEVAAHLATNSPMEYGFSSSQRWRIRQRSPMRSPQFWASPSSQARSVRRVRGVRRWKVSVRLLLFDNCEHVVDAAADLIESILAQSATVRILATSREGLGLADERLWRVPSLEVVAAVQLFAERTVSLSADESAAVEEVCRRLDGIPLAIELAASRMESMTATEVRDRLDHRFKLLIGSRRRVWNATRHCGMRWRGPTTCWTTRRRRYSDRCSVFAGGFDLRSACAVAGSDDDDYTVLDVLDALVRKSLLIADRSSGQTRFAMLETIRQFAEEQLVARGEADEVSVRRMPATSRAAKPTFWRCGTAPDSVRRMSGSPSNWPICALASGAPLTRRPRRSRHHCDVWGFRGPRVARNLRADRVGRGTDRACARESTTRDFWTWL